jgi:flavin reductase (DIM6/NTAB) family NADH-FMN oxidoreductase RutF
MSETTLSPEQRAEIAPILGKTPSGVFILTVSDGAENETGMLASWVQQASFEPPIVSVAVNSKRYVNDWLGQNPVAALSILGTSNSGRYFKQFGKGFEPDENAFEGIDLTRGTTGLPLLSEAIGSLEGRIVGQTSAGDHAIYFLQVENAARGITFDDEPYVHLRKNGFNY